MNKAISTNQFAYSVSGFILASNLLTSGVYRFAKNDSWLSVLIAYIASLLLIGIYIVLSKRYPGLGLLEINNAVFGKIIGKLVSLLYILFFISLAFFNTNDLGYFINAFMLKQTPLMIIFIVFVFLCARAVRKGPAVMTRYGFLTTVVTIAAGLTVSLLLVNKYKPVNLLPALTLPVKNYLLGMHITTMLPFCEILIFMMLIPEMHQPHEFGRAMLKGLTIGAVMLLVVVLRDTLVLGKFISIFSMPSYQVARYIDIGDILTRIEIIYAAILIFILFFKVSILYHSSVSGFCRVFGIESYQPFVYIFGALICIFAFASFATLANHTKWKMTVAPSYSTFFIFILPLLTLIVSFIRTKITSSGKRMEA